MAVLILVGAVVFGLWFNRVVLNYRFATVTPHVLYRSGAMDIPTMMAYLEEYDIRSVIDLRRDTDGGDIASDRCALEAAGYRFFHLPTRQVPTDSTVIAFLKIMSDADNCPVLVHCRHGTGRAVLFSAIYRIEFEGWTNDAARRDCRWVIWKSAFDVDSKKGRYLQGYQRRRMAKELVPGTLGDTPEPL